MSSLFLTMLFAGLLTSDYDPAVYARFDAHFQAVTQHEETLAAMHPEESEKFVDASMLQTSTLTKPQVYIEKPFTFTYNDGTQDFTYVKRFSKDSLDLSVMDEDGVYRTIDREKMEDYLETKVASEIDIESSDATLWSLPAEGSDYANIEGFAQDGREVMIDETLDAFYEALEDGEHETELVVREVAGEILNKTGEDISEFKLLGTGMSNFKTSPSGRDFNVRKGINEKVNSIMIPAGGEYNFNKNLGAVTGAKGWKNALAIFGGTKLKMVPGGGLCQVSTTVYRAALDAGMPIVEQYPHSLYVHYYKEYGNGLDATIYPGVKNLRFENNTDDWILIQAYDDPDGYDATVKIYGPNDGRSVKLIGPHFKNSGPDEYRDWFDDLGGNQIGWVQVVRDYTGKIVEENKLVSSYKYLPSYAY